MTALTPEEIDRLQFLQCAHAFYETREAEFARMVVFVARRLAPGREDLDDAAVLELVGPACYAWAIVRLAPRKAA